MSDEKPHPFGGKDIAEILKIYSDVFLDKPIFRLALEEIIRLRNEKEVGKQWRSSRDEPIK